MQIREVTDLADVRGIERVNRRCWKAAYADIFPAAVVNREPATEETLRDRLTAIRSWSGVALVAVAEQTEDSDAESAGGADGEEKRIVGYAFARWGEDTKSFVDHGDAGLKEIYVDPDHWNDGVGTALLDRIEDRVPPEYDGLTLSMLAGNEPGRRFYERRGFVEVGETTDEIAGDSYDCVLFRKPLASAED